MRTPTTLLPLAVAVALLLPACGNEGDPAASGRPVVVTDMYPTTFAVEQVAGDAVDVIQIAPAGVEPHDYELTPEQVAAIADADLVVYLPDMIPAFIEAAAQEAPHKSLDVTEGIAKVGDVEGGEGEHSDEWDPHVWLDPANMAAMGSNVAASLQDLGVAADAADLVGEMTALGGEMDVALADCSITPMVVNHESFGYLAARHGFEQVGISGLSPDAEPSPAKIVEIAELVEKEGVTTIYFESLASPDAAVTIADETGAATALLDPIEGNTDDRGYPAIMRTNAETLTTGQSCS